MSKRKPRTQFELPAAGLGSVFNLAGESAPDPFRIERERWERVEREHAAKQYAEKMQRTLAECPGFVGADPPASDESKGRVVVEPALIAEAVVWLKRRFHVSENLELSTDRGLCVDLMPRKARKAGPRKVPVHFGKTEQFTLPL